MKHLTNPIAFFITLLTMGMVRLCTLKVIDTIPVGTYTNVADVIASTPAGQIVTVRDQLLAMIPDTTHPTAQNSPPSGAAPGYDQVHPEYARAIRAEITAAFAAIAAAPTA